MKIAFVDANILLRFLTGKPTAQAEAARRLFEAADQGKVALYVDEITVAEVVWVLDSFYKMPKARIGEVLQTLLAHEGMVLEHKADVLLALAWFAEANVDFADALLSVHMGRMGVPRIYSYDRHFDRLPGIERLEP